MKTQCLQCLKEFESSREAKYCSIKCRVKSHRNVTDNSVTDNETPVVTEEEFEVINGVRLSYDHVCAECKKPVHPLITICLSCFTEKRKKQLEGNKVITEQLEEEK